MPYWFTQASNNLPVSSSSESRCLLPWCPKGGPCLLPWRPKDGPCPLPWRPECPCLPTESTTNPQQSARNELQHTKHAATLIEQLLWSTRSSGFSGADGSEHAEQLLSQRTSSTAQHSIWMSQQLYRSTQSSCPEAVASPEHMEQQNTCSSCFLGAHRTVSGSTSTSISK